MSDYRKSKRLFPGDTVAVISPSWGGPSVFPHVYENGLAVLREWGLVVKEFPTARMDAEFLRAHPEVRATDVNDAFADPEVRAVFTSIGGDDSVRILPFLDKNIIANNPKILVGYSDTTTLHVFANLAGNVSLYSPSIMSGFSQMKALPEAFSAHLHDMLFDPKPRYEYRPYETYCEGYPNWSDASTVGTVNPMKPTDGWHWLQGSGVAEGALFGGCLEVLDMMKGTAFWPSREFWKGKTLFLETSEERPTVTHVGDVLRNYGMLGAFDGITGLIISRARDFSDAEKITLEKKIVTVVAGEFDKTDLPIVANFDVGHTDPQLVMPLGVTTEIDCSKKTIALVEPWLL